MMNRALRRPYFQQRDIPRPVDTDRHDRIFFFRSTAAITGNTMFFRTPPLQRGFYRVAIILQAADTAAVGKGISAIHRRPNDTNYNTLGSVAASSSMNASPSVFENYFIDDGDYIAFFTGSATVSGVGNGGSITLRKVLTER
jgi:hypothetical protein